MRRTNLHLSEHQLSRLQSLADLLGKSVAAIVRDAVDQYINEHSPSEATLLRYKGYTASVSIDTATNDIACHGRGPIGSLVLHAESLKDLRGLFNWTVDRHLEFLRSIEGGPK